MASAESMFLFEIAVEELKSFSDAKNHRLRARFGDVFTIKLKDPNEVIAESLLPRRGGKKKKQVQLRHGKVVSQTKYSPANQSVLVVSDVESLIRNMLLYPIELTHYSQDEPFVLGIVELPWNSLYIDYLKCIEQNPEQPPVTLTETYKTYDEYTSKRAALVKLNIKLSLMKDSFALTTQIRTIHWDDKPIEPTDSLYDDLVVETGTIKTIYNGGKQIDNSRIKKLNKKQNRDIPVIDLNNEINHSADDKSMHKCDEIIKNAADNSLKVSHSVNSIVEIISSSKDDLIHSSIKKKDSIASPMRSQTHINSIASLVRSQTHINSNSLFAVTKHWSSTSVEIKERLDTLNYIFGNLEGPFGNQVYCVGYFTVDNDHSLREGSPEKDSGKSSTAGKNRASGKSESESSSSSPPRKAPPGTAGKTTTQSAGNSPTRGSAHHNTAITDSDESRKYTFNICGSDCIFGGPKNPCFENVCNLDFPEGVRNAVSLKKCTNIVCDYKKRAQLLTEPFESEKPTVVDYGTALSDKDCCVKKVEQVIGGVSAKLIKDPCLCTCECTFGFIKKTTYCTVCGGYEVPGEEMKSTRGGPPFPCPIYHGIVRKKGPIKKALASSDDSGMREPKSDKTKQKSPQGEKRGGSEPDSDKESLKKKKKKKKDERFKFNYGYKAPQIGHSQCAMPCTGDMNPVPKHMGWLWTANNIPGLKVRPSWKPGAANKHVVRMLRIARFPEQELSKRKRKDTGKKKRPLKRPLLIVQKKDGEYNVTMETMKTFNKPRTVNQYPYEDKPLVVYTVGRTEEENAERQKRKERVQRRLEREKRAFLQSAFHDVCKEICLKTYQQALGILPYQEDSFCPCYPENPPPDRIDESHSCSCTDSSRSSGSATDDDEWVVEFTPPNAYFNPTRYVKKVHAMDNSTQYTYLDYKVKLLDRYGNPVPRFFTGPDGKKECSDLGGFWSGNKKWLEINVDGFIGPDERWYPTNFKGPCGEYVDAETGKFQATNGVWLTVGVDGYVDGGGNWCFYPKPRVPSNDPKKQRNVESWLKSGGCLDETRKYKNKIGNDSRNKQPEEAAFSCFGDASPCTLSQMGIAGHGHDRRLLLSTLEKLMKQGKNVKVPQRISIPKREGKRRKSKKARLMEPGDMQDYLSKRVKCKHRQPSGKGVVVVNDRGRKTLFQMKDYKNMRPKQRIRALNEEGISVSSFHVPCFSSFINSEMARQQQRKHIMQHNARIMGMAAQTA